MQLDKLSELKCLMDSKGDVNSMHKLVYLGMIDDKYVFFIIIIVFSFVFSDIRSSSIRKEILQHIKRQSEIQKAHEGKYF